MEVIGTVTGVRRYPVKSMAGEEVHRMFVGYSGAVGDRVYALLGLAKKPSFPWLTALQRPVLVRYRPRFVHPIDPEIQYPDPSQLAVLVRLPDGDELGITEPALLERLRRDLSCDVQLRFSDRGTPNSRPLSLIGDATISALSRATGFALDDRRFRANLYVRWTDGRPFFEDQLVDHRLRIGDTLTILVSKRDPRCHVIGIDPDTGELDRSVFRTVSAHHGGDAGVYAVILREGLAEAGSPIYLLP
jgi:uncharacterized protein YcbX